MNAIDKRRHRRGRRSTDHEMVVDERWRRRTPSPPPPLPPHPIRHRIRRRRRRHDGLHHVRRPPVGRSVRWPDRASSVPPADGRTSGQTRRIHLHCPCGRAGGAGRGGGSLFSWTLLSRKVTVSDDLPIPTLLFKMHRAKAPCLFVSTVRIVHLMPTPLHFQGKPRSRVRRSSAIATRRKGEGKDRRTSEARWNGGMPILIPTRPSNRDNIIYSSRHDCTTPGVRVRSPRPRCVQRCVQTS